MAVVVAAFDRGLATLAHHGSVAYRDYFGLVYRCDLVKPNEL